LGRRRIFGGLLKDLGRRLRRADAPDTSLNITMVAPEMPLPKVK
jgi:hypothetical protein